MWSSLLIPLPVDTEPRPGTSPEIGEESEVRGAGVQPPMPRNDHAPTRAAGWRRWLTDWEREGDHGAGADERRP